MGPNEDNGHSAPTAPLTEAAPLTALPPAFSPADVVAARYSIVRFLGRGGMGEVYEAVDLELGVPVALKTVALEKARSAGAVERLKQEVLLARTVTHPSVCRIFDIGSHRAAGSGVVTTFLTMELLAGETLSQRLHRTGRMSTAEALPLARQMAEGLEAAHVAGVVHRDLKSANVMLMPWRDGVRAVVMDFGLAQDGAGMESSSDSRAETDGLGRGPAGTPAYMAPEQVEGGAISASADIYAFGVVLYEMVTGNWPFQGETPLAIALRRLKERPPPPRSAVAGLDPRWDAAILRCLERDPARRFATAADVGRALAGDAAATAWPLRRPQAMALGAALLLALAAGFAISRLERRPPLRTAAGLPAPARALRRSVAVLGFKNLSGRPRAAWVSTALSEMLGSELAAGGALRLVSGENVARMKMELSLGESDGYAASTLARIRTNLGADFVVLGSYLALADGSLRLDLRLQDTAAGETTAAMVDSGSEQELHQLVSRAGTRLRRQAGVSEPAPEAPASGTVPEGRDAARWYAEGLSRLRTFDPLGARELLEKAVAAEPGHPLPHAALAEAWTALGYDRKADEEARKALDRAQGLSREERLAVEARAHEASGKWDKAIDLRRTLFNFFPDSLEYGLRQAGAQWRAGKGTDALATIEVLRALPAPARDDPRIDLEEAFAADALGDFAREQAAAAQAVGKAESQEKRLLVAEARVREGWALRQLGQLERARAACAAAKAIYVEAGHRGGEAQALNLMALVVRDQGDLAGARKLDEQALAVFREIGDRRRMGWAINGIAGSHHRQGDLAQARAGYEKALILCREIDDRTGVARQLNNLASVLTDLGRLGEAGRVYEEALARTRETGDRRILAHVLHGMGDLREREGDLPGSRRRYEECLATAQQIGYKRLVAYAQHGVGSVAAASGDLATARARYEEALSLRRGLSEKWTAAETRLALATLSIEEGRPAEAEGAAREAAAAFREDGRAHMEALAQATLARSLRAQGRAGEAVAAAYRAREILPRIEAPRIALGVRLALEGTGAGAEPALRQVVAEAARIGLPEIELQARLALAEEDLRSGRRVAGQARLDTLEKDATAKGFLLVARKASAARLRRAHPTGADFRSE